MIMAMLGGMIGPITAADAVTATAKSLSYPCRIMDGIITDPMAEASATPDP